MHFFLIKPTLYHNGTLTWPHWALPSAKTTLRAHKVRQVRAYNTAHTPINIYMLMKALDYSPHEGSSSRPQIDFLKTRRTAMST